MSTIKNGEIGTLDTMGMVVWEEAEDLRYYTEIHGKDEGIQDRREYIMERIEWDFCDYVETLDRAIWFLWKRPHDLDEDILSLLSIDGKIALLRKLILERSNELPVAGRMDYLARFEDNFETYARVEQIRNKVVRRYLLEPNGMWLRELVDADDWIVTAWSEFDESMSCEHKEYVGLMD